jgi:hypothetical protein
MHAVSFGVIGRLLINMSSVFIITHCFRIIGLTNRPRSIQLNSFAVAVLSKASVEDSRNGLLASSEPEMVE